MAIKKVVVTDKEATKLLSGSLIAENWSAYSQELQTLGHRYATDAAFKRSINKMVAAFKKSSGLEITSQRDIAKSIKSGLTYHIHGIKFQVGSLKYNKKTYETEKAWSMYAIDLVFSRYNEAIDTASSTFKEMEGKEYTSKSRKMDPATKLNRLAGPEEMTKTLEVTLPKLIRASKPENYRKNSLQLGELKSLLGKEKTLADYDGNRMMLFYNHLLNSLDTLSNDKYFNTMYEVLKYSKNLDSLYEDIIKPHITFFVPELLFKYKDEIDSTFGSESDYQALDEMFIKLLEKANIPSANDTWNGVESTPVQPELTQEKKATSKKKVTPSKKKATHSKKVTSGNWRQHVRENASYYQSIWAQLRRR